MWLKSVYYKQGNKKSTVRFAKNVENVSYKTYQKTVI